MMARFEIVQDDHDRFRFRLLDDEEQVLLTGLPHAEKVTAQHDVVQVRQSIAKRRRFVPQHTYDGGHFAVLKDENGKVIGRSCRVADHDEMVRVVGRIAKSTTAAAPDTFAPMMGTSGTDHPGTAHPGPAQPAR